ncbi:hypothetical protein ZIOFF_020294 [Zingiber officinale]|uniref:FAS1 domain-containing protein n=1 Tax=Zingiber officinale TaxID=94328 RepID=A0A8J5LL75_ZINOF|nr:hypothetical protein ZIOFF_020294 [Zingiber officinale]
MATLLFTFTILCLLAEAFSHTLPSSLSNSSLTRPQPVPTFDGGLSLATHEMQRAGYFSFTMLVNMVRDKLPCNATFLVPTDRTLAKLVLSEDKILDFLLAHTIPAPLRFRDLACLPTGTVLPTYLAGNMIEITNRGRREFYLNDTLLVYPDVCIAGFTFRCHGIAAVMLPPQPPQLPPPLTPVSAEPAPAPVLPPPAVASSPGRDVNPGVNPSLATSSSARVGLSMICVAMMQLLAFSMTKNKI